MRYRALARSNTGDYGGSLDDCRSALDLGVSGADPWSLGRARWVISDMAAYGNLEAWRSLSDQAIDALAVSGDAFAEGYARLWQATPYLLRGHLVIGRTALEAAATRVAEVDEPVAQSKPPGLAGLGGVPLGRVPPVGADLERGVGRARIPLGDPALLRRDPLHRGCDPQRQDHPISPEFERNASLALRRGQVLAARINSQAMVGWLLFTDPAAALGAARCCCPRCHRPTSSACCETNLNAAWACLSLDDVETARGHIDQAIAVGSVANWPLPRTRRMAIESMISTSRGDLGHAIAVADAVVVIAEQEGLRVGAGSRAEPSTGGGRRRRPGQGGRDRRVGVGDPGTNGVRGGVPAVVASDGPGPELAASVLGRATFDARSRRGRCSRLVM